MMKRKILLSVSSLALVASLAIASPARAQDVGDFLHDVIPHEHGYGHHHHYDYDRAHHEHDDHDYYEHGVGHPGGYGHHHHHGDEDEE